MKKSSQNLTDLTVSYCPSKVKFRTGTEKMRNTFILVATLTTLSAERGVLRRIDFALCREMLPQDESES